MERFLAERVWCRHFEEHRDRAWVAAVRGCLA
jgi:hypothetical protein